MKTPTLILLASLYAICGQSQAAASAAKPNILLIVGNNMGC